MGEVRIDPTCAFHGKKWSEHEGGRCLYCPLCFRSDYGYPHWVDENGQKWDVCQECGEEEALVRNRMRNTEDGELRQETANPSPDTRKLG